MANNQTLAIIIAAGKGTRMKSSLPKVLHTLGGMPMIHHVNHQLRELKISKTVLVLSPEVAAYRDQFDPSLTIALQTEQLGTAHAVLAAEDHLRNFEGNVLVAFGDTPFIKENTLKKLMSALEHADFAIAGMKPENTRQYARIKTDSEGYATAVVEFRDASPEELAIPLCNGALIAFKNKIGLELLRQISAIKGEYYLFELVRLAHQLGKKTMIIETDAEEMQGINSQKELADAEHYFQNTKRLEALENGVTLQAPETVYFSHDTVIASEVFIEPHVYFGPGVTIGRGSHIKAFSHIEGTKIKEKVTIGPFARLRPGTCLDDHVKVGNFVELKNATLEKNSKVNHLSYIGDADIGEQTNVGAGTITCNYDGLKKHKTIIEKDVFIGSNTALIAPIRIGSGAIVGAGSTLTQDVQSNSIAITRSQQKEISGAANRFRQKKKS